MFTNTISYTTSLYHLLPNIDHPKILTTFSKLVIHHSISIALLTTLYFININKTLFGSYVAVFVWLYWICMTFIEKEYIELVKINSISHEIINNNNLEHLCNKDDHIVSKDIEPYSNKLTSNCEMIESSWADICIYIAMLKIIMVCFIYYNKFG